MHSSLDNDFSIAFQQTFAGIWQKYVFLCFLLFLPRNYAQLLITNARGVLSLRAADKRCAVTLRRRQEACCHFAPPTVLLPSLAKRGDLLSLRAVKRGRAGDGG
jgi:hypothetical protein